MPRNAHHNCKHCQKPIVLVPSAAERAKKGGGTAEYYRKLFSVCSDCNVKMWYAPITR